VSPRRRQGAGSTAEPLEDLGPTLTFDNGDIEKFQASYRGRSTAGTATVDAAEPAAPARWRLDSLHGGRMQRLPIHTLPFRIGRRPDLELVLSTSSVSKMHAEIFTSGGGLFVRDLQSTNGTFVNGQPVREAPLREGDVLHFAKAEYRVARDEAKPLGPDATQALTPDSTLSIDPKLLPQQFVEGTRELKELLRESRVTVFLQPIVRLPDGQIAAYEALGRGCHPNLPPNPLDLFKIAESLGPGISAELSRLFRRKAVELLRDRTELPTLFLNTHPAEMMVPGLVPSLEELRSLAPHLDLALEIHESLLTGPVAIAELRQLLSESNISLAYDDFGAGQARLLELGDAPPHYLKFDRRFVEGIDRAPASRRRLLTSLTGMARDLLVKTVAEGIETREEAEVCAQIGFTHAQGFYFSRPKPVEMI
jgi:EAL domain-containing protein (putative c-di-GMP-specific phosphodiesterase class I)